MDIATEQALEAPILCSKCKVNQRADAESSNPWCNACRTKYHKEYEASKLRQVVETSFVKGVRAAKKMLAEGFDVHGSGMFEGREIATLILETKGPAYRDASTED